MTIFNAEPSWNGIPNSPYKDNTFSFKFVDARTTDKIKELLVHNYLLARDIKDSIRTQRQYKSLSPFLRDSQNIIILDIICKPENRLKICDLFSKYQHIFLESPKGIRGVLATDITEKQYNATYSKIFHDIKHLGQLNKTFLEPYGYYEPLPNCVILSQCQGVMYKAIDYYNPYDLKELKLESKDYVKCCLEYFAKYGFIKNYNDNSYYFNNLQYEWNPKYPSYMFCKSEPAYNFNVYDAIRKHRNRQSLEILKYEADYNVSTQTLQESDYAEACDKFLNSKDSALAIKSYMGSNKSSAIAYIIGKCREQKKNVLVITSRISLAQEFGGKFKLPLYSDKNIRKFNYKKSLICQYDSLKHINPENYDIVIVDEFASVLFHSTDNLSIHKRELVTKFLKLLKKKVVISDAFLNIEFLKILGKKVITLSNNQKDTISVIEYEKEELFKKLVECVKCGEQVSMSSNSLKVIENKLEELNSINHISYEIVTGPKSGKYKESTLKYYARKKYKKDVIVYSSTLSLGVSIYKNIKNHFHLDTGNSTNTIQSIQMLRRARKAEAIHYCAEQKFHNYSTTLEGVSKYILNNVNSNNSWAIDLGSDFENKLGPIGTYYARIEVFKNILKLDNRASFNEFLSYNFGNLQYLQM